ncbi:MAG: zinc ribbon domain-containing protein, partial [Lachnospiraceae bacterium]|nr:zinc ribbon domain-containing protein [Lachnospiraceae bacterium]
MRCPKCRAKNSADAKYCCSCQTPLTETVHISKKKCPQCGKTYSADSKYCVKCQCELVAKTNSRLPVIIISSAVAVVLVTSAVIGTQIVYPRYAFNKVIQENNSEQLVSVCRNHKSLLDDQDRLDQYNAFIDKKTVDYTDDAISYDEVIADFENFNTINSYLLNESTLQNTADNRNLIEELHKSRLLFEEAEKLFDKKSYQNAEENYSGVIKQDEKYYSLAQDKLKEIDELKLSYIQQAEEKLSANDFDGSVKILTDGINNFGYDEKYNSK